MKSVSDTARIEVFVGSLHANLLQRYLFNWILKDRLVYKKSFKPLLIIKSVLIYIFKVFYQTTKSLLKRVSLSASKHHNSLLLFFPEQIFLKSKVLLGNFKSY